MNAFSQQFAYPDSLARLRFERNWNKVDSCLRRNLPKSALAVVDSIEADARRYGVAAEIVKSLLYKAALQAETRENGETTFAADMRRAIREADSGGRALHAALLRSALADFFAEYLSENRWRIADRTAFAPSEQANEQTTKNTTEEDFRAWDVRRFAEEIRQLHLQAIAFDSPAGETFLQSVSLESVRPLLTETNAAQSSRLRPSLYDALAHRALAAFSNTANDLPKPEREFELTNDDALASAEDFVKITFTTPDAQSDVFAAIRIFQKLTAARLADSTPEALLDLELLRLRFAKERIVNMEDIEERYVAALERTVKRYAPQPATTQFLVALAEYWQSKGDYIRALEYCARAKTIAKVDALSAPFVETANALETEIRRKELSVQTEKILPPDAPFAALVRFRNIDSAHFRLVRLNGSVKKRLGAGLDEVKYLTELPALAAWSERLPLADSNGIVDYKPHSAYIAALARPSGAESSAPLPFGQYALLASEQADFAKEANAVAVAYFVVSRLSIVHESQEGALAPRGGKHGSARRRVLIADAQTGEPLQGVTVNFYRQRYDGKKQRYEDVFIEKRLSDERGFCEFDNALARDGAVFIEAVLERNGKRDTLRDERWLTQVSEYREGARERTLFFTDRALYRPSQAIYFKGVIVRSDNDNAENAVVKGRATTVRFIGANGQVLSEQQFQTNEYGSFHGVFTAPQGTLAGVMRIENESGAQSLRVEEYKRPSFEARLEQPDTAYRLGEIIRVQGSAKTFAGAVSDGAQIRYRVTRETRFPYWSWRWGAAPPSSGQKEIARGQTRADEKGAFALEFLAAPDKSVLPSTLPIFSYRVYAEVTDVSGETHSAETLVSVGYTAAQLALLANADVVRPSNVASSANSNVKSSADDILRRFDMYARITTLNGKPISTECSVRLEALEPPARLLRPRALARADRFLLSETDWTRLFPRDEYNDENREENWRARREIFSVRVRSNASGEARLDSSGLGQNDAQNLARALAEAPAGAYRLTVSMTDVSGQTLEQRRIIRIADDAPLKSNALQSPFRLLQIRPSVEPGEEARFILSSAYANARILYRVERRGKILKEEWLALSAEQTTLAVPISESDRGNLVVHCTMARDYRLHNETRLVVVPWTNKQIRVETSVFRSKVLPGAKEEWRLRISGAKGESVTAEVLAAMYDASLDALGSHYWQGFSWQTFYAKRIMTSQSFGAGRYFTQEYDWNAYASRGYRHYDDFNFQIVSRALYGSGGGIRYPRRLYMKNKSEMAMDMTPQMRAAAPEDMAGEANPAPPSAPVAESRVATMAEDEGTYTKSARAKKTASGGGDEFASETPVETDLSDVQARANLNETAFFFPQLYADERGDLSFSFTMPEALTRWKMLVFAHSSDMKTGSLTTQTLTQKDLMTQPNMPRFVREGDSIALTTKISNLAERALRGAVELQLFDAETMKPLTLERARQDISIPAAQSVAARWRVHIPDGGASGSAPQTILYRVVAKAAAEPGAEGETSSFSDGEEGYIPVLPSRMLVTETLPLWIRKGANTPETVNFTFKKLLESGSSKTLRHAKLTLEISSNPAWYAVQALPTMMEFPFDCSEQLWNKLYANALATHIVQSKPRIRAIFQAWQRSPEALVSNLEKNQELKNILLEETPWVLDGADETERKRRVAILFDINKTANQTEQTLIKLQRRQSPDGGFAWFDGMPASRFVTMYILAGIGRLERLGVQLPAGGSAQMRQTLADIAARALQFADREMTEQYERLKRQKDFNPKTVNYLGYDAPLYLYARSFFAGAPLPPESDEAFRFWLRQAALHWTGGSMMEQAMIALALKRFDGGDKTAPTIVQSFRERALVSEEMGMYWKALTPSWNWREAPIETQALLIESFIELNSESKSAREEVENMKIWLLKNKQANDWKTTKATAEACYALLLRGGDWLADAPLVQAKLGAKGDFAPDPQADDVPVEAGTGYYKISWSRGEISPAMGTITLRQRGGEGVAWGAAYWQYFERLDKITPAATTPLAITKRLYLQRFTERGVELELIGAKTRLAVGDRITVRVEIRCDREMEFVHLKDMRGAGFEPITALSRYVWNNGLGYYETMKDASANFFMERLPKGVHVFEYGLRARHEGAFQGGITTIQSMYAPEFSSHSEGAIVRVGGK